MNIKRNQLSQKQNYLNEKLNFHIYISNRTASTMFKILMNFYYV